jgi:hypothetical protein
MTAAELLTPMLRGTDQRLSLRGEWIMGGYERHRVGKFLGVFQVEGSTRRYRIFGADCSSPGCECDAEAEPTDGAWSPDDHDLTEGDR